MQAKPQLHVSALNMLSRCGEQFRRRYIEGEKIAPSISMLVGTATDRAVTKDLGNKIEKGLLIDIEDVRDTASEALSVEWEKGVFLQKDEETIGADKLRGEAKDRSVRLAVLHHKEIAPFIEPTHVQRGWTLDLSGFPVDLAGTIDVQAVTPAGIVLRDTKTSKKSPAAGTADDSTQLTAYALAVKINDGQAPVSLFLDYLVDTKTPKTVQIETVRDDTDFKTFLLRVENAVTIIEKGAFAPANADSWWCDARYCGYHSSCAYVKHPVSITI